jgi:hypothetical protein
MSNEHPKRVEVLVLETNWGLISAEIARVWPEICETATRYLATYPTRAAIVDRLRVYMRPDSGAIFFALGSSFRSYYGNIGCIRIPRIESKWHATGESDGAHDALMSTIKTLVRSACPQAGCSLRVTLVEYDDLETES